MLIKVKHKTMLIQQRRAIIYLGLGAMKNHGGWFTLCIGVIEIERQKMFV